MNEPRLARPDEIDLSQHFYDTFGNMEREISARWIVRFCLGRGEGWKPFTRDDIEKFYNVGGYKDFWFNGLIQQGFLIEKDGEIVITDKFVVRLPRKENNHGMD